MDRVEALAWYWDIIVLSTDALGKYDFEDHAGYEEWSKSIKGELGL